VQKLRNVASNTMAKLLPLGDADVVIEWYEVQLATRSLAGVPWSLSELPYTGLPTTATSLDYS